MTETAIQDHSRRDSHRPVARRVDALLGRMTLAEKIGQMTQLSKNSITPDEVAQHGIGSVLSGGGSNPTPNTPADWAAMVRPFLEGALRSRLGIPLLYGVDAVHGHNNVRGATIFPHNIGLGAAGDPDLMTRVARITAREMAATHVHWNFAPALSVARDIRWGRTYESYGDDPDLVGRLGAAFVSGLQQGNGPLRTAACAKHFVGDGGTGWGSTRLPDWLDWWSKQGRPDAWSIDQGVTDVDEATLRRVHLAPYLPAIAAGVRTIMVSYSSWGGMRMHAHRYLLSDVLKGQLGFDGFLISDFLAVQQLDPGLETAVTMAINAGLDMVMVPFDRHGFQQAVSSAVRGGRIPLARIDDAVGRILRVKFELGLFEAPLGDEKLLADVGSPAHRAVAREAVARSLVVLKNEGGVLPLPAGEPLLLAGEAADDIGLQCGGWSIEWLGSRGPITDGTTLRQGLIGAGYDVTYAPDGAGEQRAATALVVLAEEPYAEGLGDQGDLTLSDQQLALLHRVRDRAERLVLLLYSGRPLVLGPALDLCDALVAAWLPGTEGGGIVDVLSGRVPATGRLPHPWPRSMDQIPMQANQDPLFPRGFGLAPAPLA